MTFPAQNSLVVIGAGPVGLEAALAALDLGFDVQVLERGEVGAHPLAWGHIHTFTPWRLNLGRHSRAHLEAAGWTAPPPEEHPTGLELVERYLKPLAALPELKDRVHTGAQVVRASRHGLLRHEGDIEAREARPFRLLVRDPGGRERLVHAFTLVDATGVYGQPACAGTGGIPARGELYLRPQLAWHVEDVRGLDRGRYAGQRTALIGDGTFAAFTLRELAGLVAEAEGTSVTWITRATAAELFPDEARDALPERRALRQWARGAAAGAVPAVTHVGGAEIEELEFNSATHQFRVIASTGDATQRIEAGRVIANVGFGPDAGLCRELQADEPRFVSLGHRPHVAEPEVLLETGYLLVADALERAAARLRDRAANGPTA
jgi:cation diffusion facilitator CzcD-associated flavoprotein CzcO